MPHRGVEAAGGEQSPRVSSLCPSICAEAEGRWATTHGLRQRITQSLGRQRPVSAAAAVPPRRRVGLIEEIGADDVPRGGTVADGEDVPGAYELALGHCKHSCRSGGFRG